MESIITASHLFKCFETGDDTPFFALKDVNIEVPKGRLTILKGRSGSGKTTLMNLLSTLDSYSSKRPSGYNISDKSDICFDGVHYEKLSERDKEKLRRKDIGFIFQAIALVPLMNAYENVDFSLRLANYGLYKEGKKKNNLKEVERIRDERIKQILSRVGMEERMLHLSGQMSGGEQQRVAIARAVAPKPKIVFADEPTGALDTETGLKVMRLFKNLIEKEGITIVMTTHDPGLMELGDVVYEMEDGEIIDRREN